MSVLVTVGTTLFEDLISEVDKPEIQKLLKQQGYSEIVCQIGSGKYVPSLPNFRSVPNLAYFIESSSLVISHAGAGTILDVLRSNKKLIVVVNPKLMNNHQTEIAEVLHQHKNLIMCRSPSELSAAINSLPNFFPSPLPSSNAERFVSNMISLLNS